MSAAPRSSLMPLDDAWAQLARHVSQHMASRGGVPAEVVDSLAARGRVLAADVVAPVNVPPFDNSAMDGYAVRLADLVDEQGTLKGHPLPVSQRIAAGQAAEYLQPGTCARIFTGATVPEGAEAVVMQEHTRLDEQCRVVFEHPVQPGQNIRRSGEDIAVGQTVLQAGTRLRAAHLGVAASVGCDRLTVARRPRVALLTTGNELTMPGEPLPPGGIYNSNRHTLMGLLDASGANATDMGTVPDDLARTQAMLAEAAEHHDLIVTSGGVSVGEEDHLRAAVQASGELHFWALGIKPGKPFVFGHVRRRDGSPCLYMGLPGNPVASFVTHLLLVSPVLGMLAGQGWVLPKGMPAVADFDWPRADKRREFLRAKMDERGHVTLFEHQGSGVLMSAAWADGLVDLPAGMTVSRGQVVRYLPWAEGWHL